MKKNVLFVLLAALTSLNVLTMQAQVSENKGRYIEVEASAEKYVMPDEISLRILIDEKDFSKKQSLDALEKEMIKTLKKIGVDIKKDLTVVDMASDFKEYKLRKNEIKLSKSYKLKVETATQAMQVMMKLDEVGISQVSVDNLKCSKIEQYQDELRVEAMKKAQSKAKTLAEAVGQTIGKAIFIREDSYIPYTPKSRFRLPNVIMLCDSGADDEETLPELEFEKYKLSCSVSVQFELE